MATSTEPVRTAFDIMQSWAEQHGGEDFGNEDGAPEHILQALSSMPGWRFLGLTGEGNGLLLHDDTALWMITDATDDHPEIEEIIGLGAGLIEEFG